MRRVELDEDTRKKILARASRFEQEGKYLRSRLYFGHNPFLDEVVEEPDSEPENDPTDDPRRPEHVLFKSTNSGETFVWPSSTKLWCWNDGHKIPGSPVPAVEHYNTQTGIYTVFGVFCCFGCAKRYVKDRNNANNPKKLNWLAQVAREVFFWEEDIKIAPPLSTLKCFGGRFSIEVYRHKASRLSHVTVRVVHPPFITHNMLYEQHKEHHPPSNDPTFLLKQNMPATFRDFVAKERSLIAKDIVEHIVTSELSRDEEQPRKKKRRDGPELVPITESEAPPKKRHRTKKIRKSQ